MTFTVDPQAIDGYAALLARARDDAQQCKTYFNGNVADLSPGVDGLINPICYEHGRVQKKLAEMLDQLNTLLGTSRDELALAATQYRRSDNDTSARLDSTYPSVPRPSPRMD